MKQLGGVCLNIEFLGQAGFIIKDGNHVILTDPFLTGNPIAKKKPEEVVDKAGKI